METRSRNCHGATNGGSRRWRGENTAQKTGHR